jgi:hypothetical protein
MTLGAKARLRDAAEGMTRSMKLKWWLYALLGRFVVRLVKRRVQRRTGAAA